MIGDGLSSSLVIDSSAALPRPRIRVSTHISLWREQH